MFCQELLKQMFLKRLYNVCYALYSKVASTNFSALARLVYIENQLLYY